MSDTEPQSESGSSRGITPLFPNADRSLGIGENNVWADSQERL
jgi:hypothetical protein